jgi:uncharacterized protein DUF4359
VGCYFFEIEGKLNRLRLIVKPSKGRCISIRGDKLILPKVNTLTLAGVAAGLMLAVGLAATNPTMEGYVHFVEARLAAEIDKMDQSTPRADRELILKMFRAQGSKLVDGFVRPKTTRSNWGLLSLFETNVLEESVLVLGVAGQFIPLRGVEEATLKVGRLAF